MMQGKTKINELKHKVSFLIRNARLIKVESLSLCETIFAKR